MAYAANSYKKAINAINPDIFVAANLDLKMVQVARRAGVDKIIVSCGDSVTNGTTLRDAIKAMVLTKTGMTLTNGEFVQENFTRANYGKPYYIGSRICRKRP